MPEMYAGTLAGTTQLAVSDNGSATFDDLSMNMRGRYYIVFRFVSLPTYFNFEVVSESVEIYPSGWVEPTVDVRKNVRIRFSTDYKSTVRGKEDFFETAIRNHIMKTMNMTSAVLENFVFTEGNSV